MKRLFGILALLPLSMAALSQSVTVRQSSPTNQNLTPQQQAAVVRLSNLQKNFGKSSMNSPGVTLSLNEINRRRITDRTLVTYELYATGMPKDHIFTIFEVKISGQFNKLLEGVTLDSDGQAICAGRKGTCSGDAPNNPVDLVFFAGKAEPKRLALVSEDGQFKGLSFQGWSCSREAGPPAVLREEVRSLLSATPSSVGRACNRHEEPRCWKTVVARPR